MKTQVIIVFFILTAVGSVAMGGENTNPPAFPETPVAFMGDWVGTWEVGEEKHPEIAAQVIAQGSDEYQIILVSKLYVRTPPILTITAKVIDGSLGFDDGFFWGEITGDTFVGGKRDEDSSAFQMKPFTLQSPSLGAKPPWNAIVLFDGSNFTQWKRFPRGAFWSILETGILQANPKLGAIETNRKFKDCKLHLEFRTPYLPEARGQNRGNSGVFVQDYYEVQILDSYGLQGYWNECGAIYRISAPYVNMCLPPLQWQTYDIEFRAARFDRRGKLKENARMTVIHNGVVVQKDQKILHGTSGDAKSPPVSPIKTPEPLHLQAHGNCVQFRNIWIRDLTNNGVKRKHQLYSKR